FGGSRFELELAAGQQREISQRAARWFEPGVSRKFLIAFHAQHGRPRYRQHVAGGALAIVQIKGVSEAVLNVLNGAAKMLAICAVLLDGELLWPAPAVLY